jgi:hypothetical protein
MDGIDDVEERERPVLHSIDSIEAVIDVHVDAVVPIVTVGAYGFDRC